MPLPREHLLDELATAYVQIVAAAAGATIAVSRRDYGVDGTVKQILSAQDGYYEGGYPIEFQLKGTTVATQQDTVRYDLNARNYNLVVTRGKLATPCYLFLICFPRDVAEWAIAAENKLVLNASAFWWTDSGSRTQNVESVRIQIPAKNRLTSDAIEAMLTAARARVRR
jgi:hypothetical protein